MLQFTVHIQNIHFASTQHNQPQAWKPAEQQNRPRTSVSTSGKSSGKLIMANLSELKFSFERGTFKQAGWIYASCQKSQIRPSPFINYAGAQVTSAASEETKTCVPPKLSWLLQVQT